MNGHSWAQWNYRRFTLLFEFRVRIKRRKNELKKLWTWLGIFWAKHFDLVFAKWVWQPNKSNQTPKKNDNIEIDEIFLTGKRADRNLDNIHTPTSQSLAQCMIFWYYYYYYFMLDKNIIVASNSCVLFAWNRTTIEFKSFYSCSGNIIPSENKKKRIKSWIIIIIVVVIITLFWSDYVLFELRLPHCIQFMLTSTQMSFSRVIYCYYIICS